MSLESFVNTWEMIPSKFKEMVTLQSHRFRKFSIRASAKSEKYENSNLQKSIHFLQIFKESKDCWRLSIVETEFSCDKVSHFKSFQELKEKVHKETKDVDYIVELKITNRDSSNTVKATNFFRPLMKVQKLTLVMENPNLKSYLEQIDLDFLREIELCSVSKLTNRSVSKARITPGEKLFIENVHSVIDNQITNLKISEEKPDSQNSVQVVDVAKSNKVLLKIKKNGGFLEGRIARVRNNDRSNTNDSKEVIQQIENTKPRTVKNVTISRNRLDEFLLTIEEELTTTNISYSHTELQRKLPRRMKKIEYIEHLRIEETAFKWRFCPEDEQISVGKVTLSNPKNCVEYLSQIEPIKLREINIFGEYEVPYAIVFDLPQVIHAQKLNINCCCIRDNHLISFNVVQLIGHTEKYDKLTYSGINQFLKKRIDTLNTHDYNFKLFFNYMNGAFDDLLEGLNDFRIQRRPQEGRVIIINSPHSGYQFELNCRRNSMHGRRITTAAQ